MSKSDMWKTPVQEILQEFYSLKNQFTEFKSLNQARIGNIKKGCQQNVKTMMNKVHSLKQEVSNLEVQVQGKRINEKIGVQTKVTKYDAEVMQLKTLIEEYDLKIKRLTDENSNFHRNSVENFEKIKKNFAGEILYWT